MDQEEVYVRAQNLTISLPYEGCGKNCPFCVSRMTGGVPNDIWLMRRNADKVVRLARQAQVSSVLFTGKGEPLQSTLALTHLAPFFREFPMEIQTNGELLTEAMLDTLLFLRFNTIALSLNSLGEYEAQKDKIERISNVRMVARLTFNLTDMLDIKTIEELVILCRQTHASQLLLRNITVPTGTDPRNETAKWIAGHTNPKRYEKMTKAFLRKKPRKIRQLAHGDSVYEMDGVSVCMNEYCVQDTAGEEDIRSLIFQEDGHVYTAWNSPASILF
jgi:organic radical activating enzyme